MKGIIGFEDYAIECIIGVFPEERCNEQKIFVDVKVEVDIAKGIESDHLKDVYDYVQLAKLCTKMAQTKKYALIETFAYELIQTFENDPDIHWAWVKIKKPQALSLAKHTFIELETCKKRA